MLYALQSQLDYLYFLCGMAFMILGAVCVSLRRGEAGRRMPWLLLGLFGVAHGAGEWLRLVYLSYPEYALLSPARVILIVASYFFLLEFSRLGMRALGLFAPGRWVFAPLLILLWIGGASGWTSLELTAHYALGLSGGLWAGVVCVLRGRALAGLTRVLLLSTGIALGLYALCASLISIPTETFSALHPGNSPPALLMFLLIARAAIASLAAFCLWLYSQADQGMPRGFDALSSIRGTRLWGPLLFIVILSLGWLATQEVGERVEQMRRDELLAGARSAATMIHPADVAGLRGDVRDLQDVHYQQMYSSLSKILEINSEYSWAYIFGLRNGEVVFICDGGPNSELPGTVYKESSRELLSAFQNGKPFVEGPVADAWGTWISALAPVVDKRGNRVVCILGVDINSSLLQRSVARARLLPIFITILFALLVTTFILLEQLARGAARRIISSEQRFRTMFVNAPEGICILDPDKESMVEVNPALADWLGYTAAAMITRPFSTMIHPESSDAISDSLAHTMLSGNPCRGVFRFVTQSGDMRVMEVTGARVQYDGKDRLLTFMRDLTDRRRTEIALEASEHRYRAVVNSIKEVLFQINIDEEFSFLNRAWEEVSGYSLEESIGQPFIRYIYPDDRALCMDEYVTLLEGDIEESRLELRLQTKEGGQRWLGIHARKSYDEVGSITGVSGTLIDITDRKFVEEALRESEAENCAIINAIPDPMVRVTREGKCINFRVGSSARYLMPITEYQGKLLSEIIPPEAAGIMLRAIRRVLDTHEIEQFEMAHPRLGESCILDIRLVECGANDALLIIRDITERKSAEAKITALNADLQQRNILLNAANKELEAFSYSVSHDLRAPLRAIDGFSQALLEDYGAKLEETGRGYLERVRKAAVRMSQLIDDLLGLSRLSRGEIRLESVDISAIADDVAETLRESDPSREVAWDITPGITASIDPRMMRIALENLLGNAWKFTAKQPLARISFRVEQRGGSRLFIVSDNGAGFNMAYRDKLFGPFQRLHAADEFPGTGIGLATVQRIIHRHGGQIKAFGQPGSGASFTFTLGEPMPKEEA